MFLDPIRSIQLPHFFNCSLPELCRSMHSPNSLCRPARSSLLAGFGKSQFIAATAACTTAHFHYSRQD
jgi:hypothetical protein